jgi:protein-S-isoprenylcysteine O-methyltransferase Ste14
MISLRLPPNRSHTCVTAIGVIHEPSLMSLRTEFEASGAWLFRYRSLLPLLALPLVGAALSSFAYLGNNHELDEIWNVICLLISLMGLVVRVVTIGYVPRGTSGRNTRKQDARKLNTSGMYSVVRHPLYLGNYVIVLGVSMYFHTSYLVLLATCLYALYYERIMFAEEAFLRQRFGEEFERWAACTPSILPRLRGWRRAELPFSWRTVLRREYTGLFGILAVFCLLEITGDSLVEHHLKIDWPWVVLFGCGLLIYLTLRTLKKQTTVLDVEGR